MARQMVCVYGMNERIGLARVAQRQATYLAGPESQLQRDSSEATAREIDEEVKKLLDRTYTEAKELLETERTNLEKVTRELLKRETISGDEFYGMIGKVRPTSRAGEDIGPVDSPNGRLVDQTAP
jgi:cell division protease FtsH